MLARCLRPPALLRLAAAGAALLVGGTMPAGAAGASPSAQPAVALEVALPEPAGPHEIGVTELHLVDTGRADPWKPERRRELMASVWYPASRRGGERPPAPWLPAGVAPVVEAAAGGFGIPARSVDWVGVDTHGLTGAPVDRRLGGRPVVLYSPGLGTPRELGTVLVEDLASRGYVVVTVGHTFETAVQFPDGRVELPVTPEPTPDYLKRALDARVADVRFVVDQLERLDRGHNPDVGRRRLPVGLRGALDMRRVGMFGHSYGGFTAGESMTTDRRIDAGVNLDGTMAWGAGVQDQPYLPGRVAAEGLDRPFLLMGSDLIDPATGEVLFPHTHTSLDRSWADFWAHQRGWTRDLLLTTAAHNSYTDLQAVLPQVAGPLQLPPGPVASLVGTIDPAESIAAQRAYVGGFFDLHLRHRDTGLFDGPSPEHPAVVFVE